MRMYNGEYRLKSLASVSGWGQLFKENDVLKRVDVVDTDEI